MTAKQGALNAKGFRDRLPSHPDNSVAQHSFCIVVVFGTDSRVYLRGDKADTPV
jgi:hypothetical protein